MCSYVCRLSWRMCASNSHLQWIDVLGLKAIVMTSTGFAGVFGYAWVTVLHLWLGLRFDHVLLAANASAVAWL